MFKQPGARALAMPSSLPELPQVWHPVLGRSLPAINISQEFWLRMMGTVTRVGDLELHGEALARRRAGASLPLSYKQQSILMKLPHVGVLRSVAGVEVRDYRPRSIARSAPSGVPMLRIRETSCSHFCACQSLDRRYREPWSCIVSSYWGNPGRLAQARAFGGANRFAY